MWWLSFFFMFFEGVVCVESVLSIFLFGSGSLFGEFFFEKVWLILLMKFILSVVLYIRVKLWSWFGWFSVSICFNVVFIDKFMICVLFIFYVLRIDIVFDDRFFMVYGVLLNLMKVECFVLWWLYWMIWYFLEIRSVIKLFGYMRVGVLVLVIKRIVLVLFELIDLF